MKIAIIGYGKMGKMVEQIALSKGHEISVIIDPAIKIDPAITTESLKTDKHAGFQIYSDIEQANFDSVDAAIEFTQPSTAAANIMALAKKKIPVVTGTTGWHEKLDEVTDEVNKAESSLLWSSNFSIGVNLFYRIAWYAAELINNFTDYDIGGFESHHNKKIDSPSGTAKILAEGVISRVERKNKIVWDTLNRKSEEDELHFPSLRLGNVPGQHSLFFDSYADTIEITHIARSREGFASGALEAAKWLTSLPKRKGVFTIDEMFLDLVKEKV